MWNLSKYSIQYIYISHYTFSLLLTNTIFVNEADIHVINMHYK